MSESQYEIDGSAIYYFLAHLDDKYYTLFIGFLRPELVHSLAELKEGYQVYIKIKIGEHTFALCIDRPLYLLDYDEVGALEFAGDDRKLELIPSGGPVDTDVPPVIGFPSYWTAGIEPMLEFKFEGGLYAQENRVWKPLDLEGSKGSL